MSTEPLDLDALKALDQAATPGPWTTPGPDTVGQWVIYDDEWTIAEARAYSHNDPMSNRPGARGPGYIDPDANAAFIAAARTAVPALIAEVDQLRVERDWFLAEATDDARARYFAAKRDKAAATRPTPGAVTEES